MAAIASSEPIAESRAYLRLRIIPTGLAENGSDRFYYPLNCIAFTIDGVQPTNAFPLGLKFAGSPSTITGTRRQTPQRSSASIMALASGSYHTPSKRCNRPHTVMLFRLLPQQTPRLSCYDSWVFSSGRGSAW